METKILIIPRCFNRFKAFTKDRQAAAKTSTPVKTNAAKAAPAETKKIKDLEKQISDLTKLVTAMVDAQRAIAEDI